jgi:hypothetical protein
LGWHPNKYLKRKDECSSSSIEQEKMRSDKNANDFYFLWTSERSGYRQMYLYFHGYIDNDGNGIGNGGEGGGSVGTVCCRGGLPVGGGGHWIVERYATLFVSSLPSSQAIPLFAPLASLNSLLPNLLLLISPSLFLSFPTLSTFPTLFPTLILIHFISPYNVFFLLKRVSHSSLLTNSSQY